MLMYGNANAASLVETKSDTIILNLSSLSERYTNRLFLVPPNNLGANSEYDFDIKYMQWIMNNDSIFIIFFPLIIELEKGMNVFIVIDSDSWSISLIESLLKLIQQRYGFNGLLVNTIEDILYAEECKFSDYGIINFDTDLNRYSYIMKSVDKFYN